MTNEELNHIRSQVGDIREDVGELRSDVKHVTSTLNRIDAKMDENQRINIAAHLRQDSQIAALSAKLATQQGEHKQTMRFANHVWTAAYTIIAGIISAVGTWFMTGGSGSAHP